MTDGFIGTYKETYNGKDRQLAMTHWELLMAVRLIRSVAFPK